MKQETALSPPAESVLEIEGLRTHFILRSGVVKAVNGVSLSLKPGQVLGVMGESGCGKTVTALSIMDLVPYPGKVIEGKVIFNGRDLRLLDHDQLRKIRGKDIAMVFQDATAGLNPVLTVGAQIEEALTSHLPIKRREARAMSIDALRRVGMPEPERAMGRYTFELSGGMCQRVMLAIAMVLNPKVLIADEPTSGLDVTLQAQILQQIRMLKEQAGSAVILISHDLGVMAQMADEVAVMYGGYIVEQAPTQVLFQRPLHPYTWGLMRAIPRLDSPGQRLRPLRGAPPDLLNLADQCPFLPRCNKAVSACRIQPMPELVEVEPGHMVACYNLVRYEWN